VGRPAFLFWPEGQDTDPAVPRRWSVSLGHPALDRQQFQPEGLQQLPADGAPLATAATTAATTAASAASAAAAAASAAAASSSPASSAAAWGVAVSPELVIAERPL
jgi:hypothetical protein